jgi:hypothetical protein
MWTFRSIPTDGRAHASDPEPSFLGHGVAKWEGDTLVIDSIAFKDHLKCESRSICKVGSIPNPR